MESDQLILLRNLFLRALVIGVVLALIIFGATTLMWDTAAAWVSHLFKVDEKELGRLALQFFLNVRVVLIFLFLTPAIALHWTAKKR